MCGIVGYVGQRDTAPLLLEALQRLEYRGYDSAGIAVIQDGSIRRRRSAGKLVNLASALAASPLSGRIGIGHTRWATHGKPSEENAHPHTDCTGNLVVIHNGIIENYVALKAELQSLGHVFASETDSEVLVHLIEQEYCPSGGRSLVEATRRALARVKGAHAAVVMSSHEPDRLVAARLGNAGGLVVGAGARCTSSVTERWPT
jgi:glucosamine--fructose-6-phosphate aminotransferase (isomerizing)